MASDCRDFHFVRSGFLDLKTELNPMEPGDVAAHGQRPAAGAEGVCVICFDAHPPPIQSGCACRADGGLAHVSCHIAKAVAQQEHRGDTVWWLCQTCNQRFTGATEMALADAWWLRARNQAEGSAERLGAAVNLASSLSNHGKHVEAAVIEREVLAVQTRLLGTEHASTLWAAANLARSLSRLGRYTEAEQMQREVLAVQTRVLGTEHPYTLWVAASLASTLFCQRMYAEAEHLQREVLAVQTRLLGTEHASTLWTTANLARALFRLGNRAEAERMLLEVLAIQTRVLGAGHPDVRWVADLAESLRIEGDCVEETP